MTTFKTLRKIMPAILDSGVSCELISPPGLGKSEFVEDLVADMSKRDGEPWGFATMFLATQTAPDLVGYQFKSERTFEGINGGKPVAITDPTMPLWMQTVDGKLAHQFRRGVLFLDEYGQGEPDVKRASAELLLNRRIGKWQLPDGWSVIAASNRSSDRSGVTKSFDFVINRRVEFHITPDVTAWIDWATKRSVDPVFIAFAEKNSNIVFDGKIPDVQGPWCTPRSLMLVERIFQKLKLTNGGKTPDDTVALTIASGQIGEAAAAQLMAFVRLSHAMPDYQDIVRDPKGTEVPKAPDSQMMVVYELAGKVSETDVDPVVTYIDRMPKEFSVTFAKAAIAREPDLINTNAFGAWCARNATLMSAVVNAE